jgi:hypothetical protein
VNLSLALLILLIGSAPVILMVDVPLLQGFVCAVAAATTLVIGLTLPRSDGEHLLKLSGFVAVVTAAPVVAILIQLAQLKAIGLSNPIWDSAAAALGQPLAATISIDRGGTIVVLVRFLAAAAILFSAMAIAVDRRRAQRILGCLAAAATAIAVISAIVALSDSLGSRHGYGENWKMAAIDGTVLGVVLTGAAAIQAYERYRMRRTHSPTRARSAAIAGGVWIAGCAICWSTLMWVGDDLANIAALFGFGTLIIIAIICHVGFRPWEQIGLLVVAVGAAVYIVIFILPIRVGDPTLSFVTEVSPALVGVTERVLADIPITGTGAGTFAALLPIYRGVDEVIEAQSPPTTAAAIAIEFGRPVLVLALLTTVSIVGVLMRGALQRGRDYFYSGAGAGCVLALLFLMFGNAGFLNTAISIITAATLGLAFAQRTGRVRH